MAGTLTIGTLSDGTNSASATDAIKGSARAWVNFNGVTTATIRASYNVSSVTRNGTGDYTVNFTNAMPDSSYVAAGISRRSTTGTNIAQLEFAGNSTSISTNTCQIKLFDNGNAVVDSETVCVAFFR